MKKIFYFGIILSLAFSSCEQYLDVNEDQSNSPLFDNIAPNQMLAGAINNYTNYQVGTLATYGNRLSYVWGLNSGFTSTDAAYTYVFGSSSYSASFESAYLFAGNFQDILNKETVFPNYKYHFGVAKIFKVMCMDYVTALYGDAPYSEAFKSELNLAPKYDDDKTIIPKLFVELDEARAYLADADAEELGAEDIVFAGDTDQWIKFANTIELKILLRLSKTTDPALVSLRNTRFAAMDANQNFIDSDVTCNPGYNSSALGQRSPLYRLYGLNEALSGWTSANRANAAGDYIAKIINGEYTDANILADVVDPRRTRMFTTVGGVVVGNVQGVFPLAAISRFGSFYFGRLGSDDNGMSRDAFLMLAAESKFLQAEAFQRHDLVGGYLTGDAHQAFTDGITASFDFYSTPFGTLTSADLAPLNASTYIATTDLNRGLGWNGSADKLNAIMTQKYLALAQWHGIELYIDNQRTGFPVLPLPVGITQTTRPNRLIYPTSEYSSNSANVPNVVNSDLFTVNAKTPYYLQ